MKSFEKQRKQKPLQGNRNQDTKKSTWDKILNIQENSIKRTQIKISYDRKRL